MASPQIKILLSLAAVSIVYAFVCQIRMTQMASRLSRWIQKERPDLWSELNYVARNWHGGHPGLKILKRRNVVGLPVFDQEYEQLHSMERKFFWGVGIGSMCIGVLIMGFVFLGWHW
jgi:hypothetical protein